MICLSDRYSSFVIRQSNVQQAKLVHQLLWVYLPIRRNQTALSKSPARDRLSCHRRGHSRRVVPTGGRHQGHRDKSSLPFNLDGNPSRSPTYPFREHQTQG
jgi:hypothetical protein